MKIDSVLGSRLRGNDKNEAEMRLAASFLRLIVSTSDKSKLFCFSSQKPLTLTTFGTGTYPKRSLRTPLFLFFFAVTAVLHADSSEETKQPVLLLEPSFYHHPISTLIPGAKKTVVTAAWVEKKSFTISFLEPSWNTTGSAFMSHFVQEGRQTLSERLSSLHPRFLRDEHQVIQVAIIESDDLLTASTILAPDFAQQFVKIFGPELLLAIPTANRIYVFSKLASSINSLAPAIRDDYKLSSSPVSLEIFELDFKLGEGRLHAIGSLDPNISQ